MVHVGVDLHKQTSQIAVLSDDGELRQHRLVNDVERLEQFFAQLPPKTPVAIEASGTWWWLVDLLEKLGHQPVLSHPKQTKAIAAARLKLGGWSWEAFTMRRIRGISTALFTLIDRKSTRLNSSH